VRAVRDFAVALLAASSIAAAFAALSACFTPKTARICVEVAAVRDAGSDAR